MPRLPTELVAKVIEEAQYDDLLPRYRWLRRYALVSREWCPYAQSLIFRRIVLVGGVEQCEKVIAALSGQLSSDAEHTAFLRGCVKTLILSMDHRQIYVDVLMLCTNLVELGVKLHHACFRPEALCRLKDAPKIKALHVRSAFYKPMYQLLSVFPDIESLDLDARSMRNICEPFTPQWKLRELRLYCIPQSTLDLLSWIFSGPSSRESLEILHINNDAPSELFSDMQFPNLRSLHARSVNEEDVRRLPPLEELGLHVVPPSQQSFARLPLSIQHLLLPSTVDNVENLVEGLTVVQHTSGCSLRALTYTRSPQVERRVEEKDVRVLQLYCHQNELQFRFMDPPYGAMPGEVGTVISTYEISQKLSADTYLIC
ncbi:hypothetical protein NLI96_g9395 [Meripilus lineatus]|uniref:F-box domain-containing protein n=1 Tax=Meripilus lineatus TaxID=2056292 RepID=A0AAD5YCY7_9APHY|nr:hypothetical protein NLI96_g9395 [Physisporinus lineatus]